MKAADRENSTGFMLGREAENRHTQSAGSASSQLRAGTFYINTTHTSKKYPTRKKNF